MSTQVKVPNDEDVVRLEHVPDEDEEPRGTVDLDASQARLFSEAVKVIFVPTKSRDEFVTALLTAADMLDIRASTDLLEGLEGV